MTSMDRPDRPIPGTGTTTTAPPTPAGGPPITTPPPDHADEPGGSVQSGKEATHEVAGHARSEVEDATDHAVEQGRHVAETAKSEVRDVVDEARDAVREQADRQAHVAADALGRLRDDLQAMGHDEAPRDATAKYLRQAAGTVDDLVDRLERDGIEGALSGIRSFARRSPGGFLLASAGAGFAIGRILRNGDHPQQVDEQRSSAATDRHATSGATSGQQEIDLTDDARAARFDRDAVEQGASRTGSFAGSDGSGVRR